MSKWLSANMDLKNLNLKVGRWDESGRSFLLEKNLHNSTCFLGGTDSRDPQNNSIYIYIYYTNRSNAHMFIFLKTESNLIVLVGLFLWCLNFGVLATSPEHQDLKNLPHSRQFRSFQGAENCFMDQLNPHVRVALFEQIRFQYQWKTLFWLHKQIF